MNTNNFINLDPDTKKEINPKMSNMKILARVASLAKEAVEQECAELMQV